MSGNLLTGRVVGNDPNNTVDLIGNVLVNGEPIQGLIIQGNTGATGVAGPIGPTGSDGVAGPTGSQGLQGIQGVAGSNAVSPSGLIWRGTWNATYSYAINDAVGYGSASWFCFTDVTARPIPLTPNDSPDIDTTHWALLAMQGSQGIPGAQGPQGIPGIPGPQGPTGGGEGGSQSQDNIIRYIDADGFDLAEHPFPASAAQIANYINELDDSEKIIDEITIIRIGLKLSVVGEYEDNSYLPIIDWESQYYCIYEIKDIGKGIIPILTSDNIVLIHYQEIRKDHIGLVIANDIEVRLFNNKTLGKYKDGDIIPSAGKGVEEVLNDIAYEYNTPVFEYFQTNYQLVEVGTTFSSMSFYWSLLNNDGLVDTIDIYDNNYDQLLITAPILDYYVDIPYNRVFTYEGDTQSFKGIANNTNPTSSVPSEDNIIRSNYYLAYGGIYATPSDPNDGSANRDYIFNDVKNKMLIETPVDNSSEFQFKIEMDMFYFSMFTIMIPKYSNYSYHIKVWDDINGVDLTSYYINDSIIVKDAGGNDIVYDQYVYSIGIAYNEADGQLYNDTDFTHTITIYGQSGS
jgi:hypothetical protein